MKTNWFLGVFALIGSTLIGASGADAVGKITLKGTPPEPQVVALDKTCGEMRKENQLKIYAYAVGASNALADVVVYVKGAPDAAAQTGPVVLEQKNCQYTPFVAVAQVNQPVQVRNSDPLMHS